MDKEKAVRKKSTEKYESLPLPPPDPVLVTELPDAFKRLQSYKQREATFLKTLKETIEMETVKTRSKRLHLVGSGNSIPCDSECASEKLLSESDMLTEECENYIAPLLKRSGPSITAALVTQGAIDQLDKLHLILGQLLYMQEQNYKVRRNTRDVDTLIGLKKMQRQMTKDPEGFLNANVDFSDPEHELELEYNESLLETILAAGKSATNKRNSSKSRQRIRSKSVISEDINSIQERETKPFRRQSTINDVKSKVSKWTKVKAAFKWERANVTSLNEGKSTDSGIGLSPINNEVARYLRVPSVPCAGSSADSVLSSSSGHLLSGGSIPPSPGTISSASSIEDIGAMSEEFRNNRDSSKSESRCDSRTQDEEARRSRSLDGDATLSSSFTRHLEKQNKNKTPWRKVKDIITTHRGSLKGKSRSRSVKSTSSVGCSRDASPCDSTDAYSNIDTNPDRTESCSSSQTSPIRKTNPSVMLTAPIFDGSSNSNSPISPGIFFGREEFECKFEKHTKVSSSSTKSSRKSKISLDIVSVPEGMPMDSTPSPSKSKPPQSPLNPNYRQELVDVDLHELRASPTMQSKSAKLMKTRRQINSSGPSSPSQLFEFFGEFESEELSSGDFSEPCTPHTQLTPKGSLVHQQDEINRKYHELQQQISLEFQAKQREWERIRTSSVAVSCPVPCLQKEDLTKDNKKEPSSKPIEDNLSADFKKKLQEWRIKKQQSVTSSTSPTKEADKKIDWHLWKTGQIKLEGQGLKQLPDEKDLPEDFQKKLDEWKRMKASGSIPTYNNTPDINVKRQSLKLAQISKNDGGKKVKNADDIEKELHKIERERQRLERERIKCLEREKLEKLSKLKAMVAEPPAKEIVVQTSKGVLKFEGISRKFTRKLYEWEKSRGIGPESSTFALLHPGYRPLVVGNGEGEDDNADKGSPLARSLSMDSMSPNPSVLSISHQPSSLSLNNVDDLKGSGNINDRRISSNPEFDLDITHDEPEAVIVEVEDDYIDTASSLVTASPMIEKQTPVYRYEQTRKEYCAGKKEAVFLGETSSIGGDEKNNAKKTLKDVSQLSSFKDDIKGYRENVLHVQTVLQSLIETVPMLKTDLKPELSTEIDLVKDLTEEIVKKLDTLDESVLEKDELDSKMTSIDNDLAVLRKTLNILFTDQKSNRSSDLPEISITPDDMEKRIALVNVTPVFQGEVVVNEVKIIENRPIPSVETLPSGDGLDNCEPKKTIESNSNNRSTDQDSKKTNNKPVSNGTKAKRKLRRLGSRQSSKTESDSDEDTPNIILDAPRRVKRKTSKSKKVFEIEKSEEPQLGEDVAYVLKIRPGARIEQTEEKSEVKSPQDDLILISPTETCVELIDGSVENLPAKNNIFVKTKRKIFSPVENKSDTVIGRDLESSSASDKNDTEKGSSSEKKEENEEKIITNLPPLPQSPSNPRRLDSKPCSPKEPSPVIRFMIAKYNQRLSAERKPNSPQSSGSCSPTAWRSPVLERRIKEQTEKYLYQVTKSSSAGMVENNIKNNFETSSYSEDILDSVKSSSANTLTENWNSERSIPTENEMDVACRTPLACDSLREIYHKKYEATDLNDYENNKKVYFKNDINGSITSATLKTGTIRKISSKIASETNNNYETITGRSFSGCTLDRSSNTVPKIKRKYDSKSLSPSTNRQSLKNSLDLNIRNAALSGHLNSPGTPLSDRALKLKKAKEEFLKQSSARNCQCNDEEIWKNRTSQISIGSQSSNEECAISKSASAGIIGRDEADNRHLGGYVSLPRSASKKSDKIDGQASSAKFGFSTIASKFKKVAMRKNSKELEKMNTVTKLCRQSLMVDITKEVPIGSRCNHTDRSNSEMIDKKELNMSNENLRKSGSTTGFSSLLFRRHERAQKLKKSKSIGQLEEPKRD